LAYGQNNKENILFKDPLQSILVKGVAIETSLAILIKIMAWNAVNHSGAGIGALVLELLLYTK
jgi:hypothetical protein